MLRSKSFRFLFLKRGVFLSETNTNSTSCSLQSLIYLLITLFGLFIEVITKNFDFFLKSFFFHICMYITYLYKLN